MKYLDVRFEVDDLRDLNILLIHLIHLLHKRTLPLRVQAQVRSRMGGRRGYMMDILVGMFGMILVMRKMKSMDMRDGCFLG